MTHLVTREGLQGLVTRGDEVAMHAIGRALVALFERQTKAEKEMNDTRVWNTVGFSGADARSGSITAKFYIKHKRLEDWQMAKWLKPGRNGFARITKYWRQLDEVAQAKAARKAAA